MWHVTTARRFQILLLDYDEDTGDIAARDFPWRGEVLSMSPHPTAAEQLLVGTRHVAARGGGAGGALERTCHLALCRLPPPASSSADSAVPAALESQQLLATGASASIRAEWDPLIQDRLLVMEDSRLSLLNVHGSDAPAAGGTPAQRQGTAQVSAFP